MTSIEIRQAFFDFFKNKQHKLVDSAPIVMKNDPTLLFTNAGMNQFKDAFLGNAEPPSKRVVDSQKCLRVSGKHNDLEEVGVDTYHHTMFEMLGNWSFGDYFKADTIPWAWELLTEVYGIPADKLYVTVFEGDDTDGLPLDQEAYDAWKQIVPEARIIPAGKKDNFWEMGATGPCGPCSEIHVDLRSEDERKKTDGRELVNQDHPQVVEIWNLVFMEFNRMQDGSLKALPAKHVDTGMGLERLCMALQGKQSNYDTDLFMPLIHQLEKLSGKKYGFSMDNKADIAFRVIADHLRAVAFAIADGQLPSNTGAGYVIRRILRRAVRYGYSFLDFDKPFMFELLPTLIESLGSYFGELKSQSELISKVIKEEEASFLRTLEKGINLFENYQAKQNKVEGQFAFELYDTYGFPIDLTQLLAQEKGWEVDMQGFEAALKEQKDRSRAASKSDAGDWIPVSEGKDSDFLGYDQLEATVKLRTYRKVSQKKGEIYQLVFDQTPFYPEGGGQVGDQGYIEINGQKTSIFDTKKENNQILHFTKELPSNLEGDFKAVVSEKRRPTVLNHTATHLLHHALRNILGEHVEQKGSLVHPDYLRFDFSHFQKVSDEELKQIEESVNAQIRANYPLEEERAIAIEEAKAKGAMALFGEKYGDTVRTIQFGDSIELCGGTHAKASGDLGFFKIISESAVAAGVRRIEAVSGAQAEAYVQEEESLLNEIKAELKNAKQPLQALKNLMLEQKKLTKELEQLKSKAAGNLKNELKEKIQQSGDFNYLIEKVGLDAGAIKQLAFQFKGEQDRLFLMLASDAGDKPTITLLISEDLAKEKGWDASKMIRDLAKHIKGGGGGQFFFATAGGKKVEGIEDALMEAKKLISD
jgi:alanyl-tRNA synthetase